MGGGFWPSFVTVLTGIIGLAILATLVSKNANTAGVVTSFWSGFSQSLQAAEAPVTGTGSGLSSFGGVGSGLTSNF